jgi:hypothetical protein
MCIRNALFVLCSILGALALPLSVGAQPFCHAWSDGFGDATYQYAYGLAADGSGNLIVTGWFAGTLDFGGDPLVGAGSQDIYIAKFDAAGNHRWSKSFGDAGAQYGYDVKTDPWGNIVLLGYFSGVVDFGGGALTSAGGYDIFVAKFDANGTHLWSKRFGDASTQYAHCVAIDGQGNVIITGHYYGSVDFGGGPHSSSALLDIYVAKFDAGGNYLWSQSFGGTGDQYGEAIVADAVGSLALAGPFAGSVDFGGGPLNSAGTLDIYVARLKPSGLYLWSQRFGDASYQIANAIAIEGSNNIVVAGEFEGTVNFGGGPLSSAGNNDVFVAKFNSGGTHLWSRSFGDGNDQTAVAVTTDRSGNVAVAGDFKGTLDFGGGPLTGSGAEDIFLAEFDANGNHIWSQRFGDPAFQHGFGVAADGWGNLTVAGHITGTTDFGGGPINSAGSFDVVLARFWRAEPRIAAVRDVPGDQGGWVNLSWDASGADTPAERAITRYSLWRAIAPSSASSLLERGASLVADPSAIGTDRTAETDAPLIRLQRLEGTTYYWYLMESVDAYYLPGYSAPLPTLFDSTGVSTEYHYFQVIAHTGDPSVFWVSAPDSGYSVDNLAPATPLSLAGWQSVSPAGLSLSWRSNGEPDLWGYAVYRGSSEGFVPGPGNQIAALQDTSSFDGDWTWDGGYYYKVSAVDLHGNESPYALLSPESVTGAGGSPVPSAAYLGQSCPNPFRHSTRIAFGLAETTEISLAVYDVSGRLVRVLAEGRRGPNSYEVEWDGTNARGERVASGVYFYHLEAGGRTHIRKAVLLR